MSTPNEHIASGFEPPGCTPTPAQTQTPTPMTMRATRSYWEEAMQSHPSQSGLSQVAVEAANTIATLETALVAAKERGDALHRELYGTDSFNCGAYGYASIWENRATEAEANVVRLTKELDEAKEIAECCDKQMGESDWCRQYNEACQKIATMDEDASAIRADRDALAEKLRRCEGGLGEANTYLASRKLVEVRPGTFAAVDEHLATYLAELRTQLRELGEQLEGAKKERLRLEEYAFGMETALRGARASGTASEAALFAAECAELRMQNADLRRAYNECWAGSPAVKEELDSLRTRLAALQQQVGEDHKDFREAYALLINGRSYDAMMLCTMSRDRLARQPDQRQPL